MAHDGKSIGGVSSYRANHPPFLYIIFQMAENRIAFSIGGQAFHLQYNLYDEKLLFLGFQRAFNWFFELDSSTIIEWSCKLYRSTVSIKKSHFVEVTIIQSYQNYRLSYQRVGRPIRIY